MAVITNATVKAAFRSFDALFNQAFKAATPEWGKVAMKLPSTTSQNVLAWLDRLPTVREWLGDRVIQDIVASGYTLTNQDWETTVGLSRNDIEDDNIGIYRPIVQHMGSQVAYHPDTKIYPLLTSGFTDTCYDGVAFFGTHTWQDSSFTNTDTLALSPENYETVFARLTRQLGGPDGKKPLMSQPKFLLVVPPELRAMAMSIVSVETDVYGASNKNFGTAELLVSNLLTSATKWFLLVVNNPVMPLVFQERTTPKATNLIKDDDENVVMRKQYIYGYDYRGTFGYGLWQLAYGCNA